MSALTVWNQRCSPPWSDKELRHKLSEARKKTVPVTVPVNAVDDGDDTAIADDWPTLNAAAYYGVVGDIVKTIEPHTEADPVALLLTLLTAYGCCLGRKAYYEVEGDKHYANLFTAIVGDSAKARKGTSYGRVLSLFDGVDDTFNDRRLSGLSSGEGLINALKDDDVPADGVKTIADKRAWVYESERASVLKRMKRENNVLSCVLRHAWDRGELQTLTKGTPLKASGVHVAITAHITRQELVGTMNDTEAYNGFGNRFLWALVKRSKLLPDGGNVDVSGLRTRLRDARAKAVYVERMTRSPDCAKRWREVYPVLGESRHGLWDAITSRAESQVLRLSMAYALFDCSPVIELPHLEAALAVWRYCDDSARLLFADAKESEDGTLETKLRNMIRQRPGIMRSELRKAVSHRIKTETFTSSLSWLIGRGDVIRVPVTGSRQAETYYPGTGDGGYRAASPLYVSAGGDMGTGDVGTLTDTGTLNPPYPVPAALADTVTVTDTGSLNTPSPVPATLGELITWKNAYGVRFQRREDASIWVTPDYESHLTPPLAEAIRGNQGTLAVFVSAPEIPITAPVPVPVHDDDYYDDGIDTSTWSPEGLSLYDELMAMEH